MQSRKNILKLELNQKPIIATQVVYPTDTEFEQKQKLKFPFKLYNNVVLTVKDKEKSYTITAYKNYCFDGATIPFGLGGKDTRLLVPSLFHDIMCEKKYIIDYDRKLSSDIFYELLIMCGMPKLKAKVMRFAVDNYQKLQKSWRIK